MRLDSKNTAISAAQRQNLPPTILSSLAVAQWRQDDPAVGLFDLYVSCCFVYAITPANDKCQIDQTARQTKKISHCN